MARSPFHNQTPLSDAPSARHVGDLARSDRTWSVYMETRPQGRAVGGRLFFQSGSAIRETAWIFLEWHERDILNRFNEFSPTELWNLMESLG